MMLNLGPVAISTDLLGALAAAQGIATLAIDLTRTHATNPSWPGHARFHVVWQSANVACFTLLAEYLLWDPRLREADRFHLALCLTVIPMVGFLLAMFCRSLYRGTLQDRNGIAPLVMHLWGARREIDLNVVAVVAGLFVSAILLGVHDHW